MRSGLVIRCFGRFRWLLEQVGDASHFDRVAVENPAVLLDRCLVGLAVLVRCVHGGFLSPGLMNRVCAACGATFPGMSSDV